MLFCTAFSHGIHTTIVFQSHSPFWYCISYIFPCAQCLLFKLSAIFQLYLETCRFSTSLTAQPATTFSPYK
jgi:hypothetical protein